MRFLIPALTLVVFTAGCSSRETEVTPPDQPAVPIPASLVAGRYCAVADTEGGQSVVQAVVAGTTQAPTLAVSSAMPDSDQILDVGPEPAQIDSDGKLFFSFEDGWQNQGLAMLSPSGQLSLSVTKPSDDPMGSNVRRNYGDYTVTQAACAKIRAAG